jgi:hypothetical protein
MRSGHARTRSLLAILAFSGFAAPEKAAAQMGSDIGPTSRASLQIRVSVAERVGLRMSSAGAAPNAGPCDVSTARARAFTATLEPLHRSSEGPTPPPLILAAPAGETCRGNEELGRALAALRKDGSIGPHLLVLAPQ